MSIAHPIITPATHRIGFIGLGVMGAAMAGHLLTAGYRVTVSNRSRSKGDALVERGAVWADSPAEVAAVSDVVCTIVGYPSDVEAVWLGSDGILSAARPGMIGIDLTTSSPSLAVRVASVGAERGMAIVDAPVSGGDIGAREARLSIMVGGTETACAAALPVLQCLGTKIVRQGGPGAGQHCKLANQIAGAANIIGVSEALAYARTAGLDPQTVLASIAGGAAGSWALTNLAPRMLAGDFAPGFAIKHFLKDLAIALAEAKRLKLELPGLALAERLYQRLTIGAGADQAADWGTQALISLYA